MKEQKVKAAAAEAAAEEVREETGAAAETAQAPEQENAGSGIVYPLTESENTDKVLYEAQVVTTFDEFKSSVMTGEGWEKRLTYMKYAGIACLVLAVLELKMTDYLATVVFAVAALALIVFVPLKVRRDIQDRWNADVYLHGLITRVEIYSDRVKYYTQYTSAVWPWHYIWGMIETDTNLFLMVTSTNRINISKASCSQEMIEYLREAAARYGHYVSQMSAAEPAPQPEEAAPAPEEAPAEAAAEEAKEE